MAVNPDFISPCGLYCGVCAIYIAHRDNNIKKVILRAVPYRREFGTEQWVRDEEVRYTCPNCGNRIFRGAMKCNQCKAQLDLD